MDRNCTPVAHEIRQFNFGGSRLGVVFCCVPGLGRWFGWRDSSLAENRERRGGECVVDRCSIGIPS